MPDAADVNLVFLWGAGGGLGGVNRFEGGELAGARRLGDACAEEAWGNGTVGGFAGCRRANTTTDVVPV